MTDLFADLIEGDRMIVNDHSGNLIAVGRVERPDRYKARFFVRALETIHSASGLSGFYSKKTGLMIDKESYRVRVASDAEWATASGIIKSENEARYAQEEAEEERRRQAEYDALPEGVKLARRIEFGVANCSIDKLAKAPIETLRAMVEWMKSEGVVTE